MAAGSPSRKLSASARRELEVAAAVARESVLQLHVDSALGLIRLADGRIPLMRALDIYLRLQTLTGPNSDMVSNRVLASFGRDGAGRTLAAANGSAARTGVRPHSADAAPAPDTMGAPAEADAADDQSLFRSMRRRLRGRVNDALRRDVELHMGVTRVALLDLHVRHAHGFARMLADAHDIAAACAVYTELLHVPPTLSPVLYIMVLDRVAGDEKNRSLPADWRHAVQSPARDLLRRRKVLDVM